MALEFKFLRSEPNGHGGATSSARFTLGLLVDGAQTGVTYEGPKVLMGLYDLINKQVGITPIVEGDVNIVQGQDGSKKVSLLLMHSGTEVRGEAESATIPEAAVRAYINAINRLPNYRQPPLF